MAVAGFVRNIKRPILFDFKTKFLNDNFKLPVAE
jgi:hypothetical protein